MYKLKVKLQVARGKLLKVMDKEIELRENKRIERNERIEKSELFTEPLRRAI